MKARYTLRPQSLVELLLDLQQDYPSRWAYEDERAPRAPGHESANESNMRAFGSDYEDLGHGCYRHLSSTNADGDNYLDNER